MAVVKIKRIRTNFQVRFGYDENLIKHIKSIPKEQIKTTFDTVITESGQSKKDWFHICNIHGLMKIMWYCQDNHILYQYENLSEKEIWKVEEYVKKRKERLIQVEKFKRGEFDEEIKAEDYSFMKIEPHLYQKKAIKFFECSDGVALLGDEPGVGKTLTAISYSVKHHFKTLVICPASLALVWAKEVLKFTNEVPYVFKYKTKKKEGLQLGSPETSKIHIVSYNALETYLKFDVHHKCQNPYCDFDEVSQVKKHKMCPKCFKENSIKSRNTDLCSFVDKGGVDLKTSIYDLVVIDECHYIKNVKSGRYKLVNAGFKKTPRKILMSGTAIKNRPYEFFPVLNFLDPFEFVNSHNFGIKYCDGKEDEWGHWNYDGSSNEETLYQNISYLYLRRRKSDPGVLECLPPKTYTIIPIYLTPEELREYKKLERGVVDDTSESDDRMVGLAKVQKLKMFTSKICAQRAFEFIRNIIDGGEKVIVFSQYVDTTKMIYEEFINEAVWYTGKKSAEEKEEAREMFMEDERIKIFSGTMGAAGVGLTLTSASVVLFLDLPWSPSDFIQCQDRAHRLSQKNNVQIITLVTQDTIDEDINELLNKKEKTTFQILDGEYTQKEVNTSIFDDVMKIILSKKNKL